MTAIGRLVAVLVVTAVALTGPLAPLASAQQPPPAAQADLYQERLKQQQRDEAEAYEGGAAVVNVFHVPGKAILCGIGGAVSLGMLLLTFGSGYKAAASLAREGCGGKWIVTGDDLRPDRARVDWQSN
jgi:hypothetical protein